MNRIEFKQQCKNELNDFLRHCKNDLHLEVFTPCNNDSVYAIIITPNKSIIYIQRNSFIWRGWDFSLQYKPSREHGSGCGTFEEPHNGNLTIDIILEAEKEGLKYAKTFKPPFYNNTMEWVKRNTIEYYKHGMYKAF